MKKEINTRFNETRFVTNSPEEMRGLYLASTLKRTWTEDFLDEETGNVISVDRSELVADLGTKIDGDLMARIQFHLQAGDIKQVEVSTQQRMAYLTTAYSLIPWSVTAVIGAKRRKILLYADSAQMAHDIAKDYIELHYSGSFHIVGLKVFEHCIFIKDTLKSIDPNDEAAEIRCNFQIMNCDYLTAIERIDFPGAFFYCDPPYPQECRNSRNDYRYEFSVEDHERLAEKLHHIEGWAMVSSYDCELTNRLYADWHKVKFPFKRNNIRSGIVNGSGTLMQECIWMNYEPQAQTLKLF